MSKRPPMYVRVSKAQELFCVARSTIYRWEEKGLIKIYRRGRGKCSGGAWIKTAEMEAFIEGTDAAA